VTKSRSRTQVCGDPQANQRLARAKSFLEVAKMTADENDPALEYGAAAASIAILAGIAAADAACCSALGRRSRSDDHHDAERLLIAITPGGKAAASQLRKLISLKDAAHYGFVTPSAAELKRTLRQADQLVEFAEQIVRR
jgi:hypothetical protein